MTALSPDIPWNPATVEANAMMYANSLALIASHRTGVRYHTEIAWHPEAAGWHANRIIETCDELERRGFFNLAQGREPNVRD